MLARRSSSVSGAMEIDNEKACSNRAGREIRRCRFRYNYNVVEWWELWGYDDWIVWGMGDSLEGALFDRFIYFFWIVMDKRKYLGMGFLGKEEYLKKALFYFFLLIFELKGT